MKLPPPSVLDVCLRRARLSHYKGDFLKIHAALVAAVIASAAANASAAAATATAPASANATEATAAVAASESTNATSNPSNVAGETTNKMKEEPTADSASATIPKAQTECTAAEAANTVKSVLPLQLPPLQTNGAGILASALVLHRLILLLVPKTTTSVVGSSSNNNSSSSSGAAAATSKTAGATTTAATATATSMATPPPQASNTAAPVAAAAAATVATNASTTAPTATAAIGTTTPAAAASTSTAPANTANTANPRVTIEPPIVTDVIAAVHIAEQQSPVPVEWTMYKSLDVLIQSLQAGNSNSNSGPAKDAATASLPVSIPTDDKDAIGSAAGTGTTTTTTTNTSNLKEWLETKFAVVQTHGITVSSILDECHRMQDHIQVAHDWHAEFTELVTSTLIPHLQSVSAVYMESTEAAVLGLAAGAAGAGAAGTSTTNKGTTVNKAVSGTTATTGRSLIGGSLPAAATAKPKATTANPNSTAPSATVVAGAAAANASTTSTTTSTSGTAAAATTTTTTTTTSLQDRTQRMKVIQRIKEVCWKLALSDCLTRLNDNIKTATTTVLSTTTSAATPAPPTRHQMDRNAAILSFAAAMGCVVTLTGNDPWHKPNKRAKDDTNTEASGGGPVKKIKLASGGSAAVAAGAVIDVDNSSSAMDTGDGTRGSSGLASGDANDSGHASDVVRAILIKANAMLRQGSDDEEGAPTAMVTAEQLRVEIVRFAHLIKAATDEQRVSLAPIVTHLAPAKRNQPFPLSSVAKKPLTFLQVLLGVATCEKLAWYLPTFSTVVYRRAVAAPVMGLTPTMVSTIATTAGMTNVTESKERRFCPWFVDYTTLLIGETALYLGSVATPSLADMCAAALDPAALTAAAHAVASAAAIPRSVTPVIISEAMELNEWAVSVTFLEVVKPSQKLKALLDDLSAIAETSSNTTSKKWHTVVLSVINKALLRLAQEHVAERPPRKAPVTVTTSGAAVGSVQVHGDLTPDKQLCKAVVALYYHALEAILYLEKLRLDSMDDGHSNNEAVYQSKVKSSHLVLNEVFHGALFTCCCSCITKAIGFTHKLNPSPLMSRLQIYSILHIAGISPFEFLKVVETFLEALGADSAARDNLGSPLIFTLPRLLQKDIRQVEINTMDSLVWARNNAITTDSLTDKILEFQDKMTKKSNSGVCFWPPLELAPTLPEEMEDDGVTEFVAPAYPSLEHEDYASFRSMSYVLRKLLRLVHQRITTICSYLQISEDLPVVLHIWKVFRFLLRHHIQLLFDRHVDHWILCSIYSVCRTIKYEPEIKFAKIIEAYVAFREPDLGSITCQRIVRHIKLAPGKTTEEGMGNVITLYNKVFVPIMKDYLLNNPSLKACTDYLVSVRAGDAPPLRPAEPGIPGVVVQVVDSAAIFDSPPVSAAVTFGTLKSDAVALANVFAAPNTREDENDAMIV